MLKLLQSKSGHIIISIILGFGLACLFRKVCKDRECIIYTAPDFKKIKDKIFKFDEKCYKYTKETSTCNDKPIK
tara:strand:- start:107 stop:328 length:222 start_codon:yes stop_codon:yes gene_type:complete